MALDLSKLRKQQSSVDFAAKVKKIATASNAKKDYTDVREWKLSKDKSGDGYAVIRFLPSIDLDNIGFVLTYTHYFQENSKWLIEKCPTTIGLPCPICEANGKLYDTGLEADKKVAGSRKRTKNYYSNVLVIKDPANPENEGKVFLYRYGQKIMDKIIAAAQPKFEDEPKVDAFNITDQGANFKLKSTIVSGYPNYDSSTFEAPSELPGNDEQQQAVLDSIFPLADYVDPTGFSTYESIQKNFQRVTGAATSTYTAETVADSIEEQAETMTENILGNTTSDGDANLSEFDALLKEGS